MCLSVQTIVWYLQKSGLRLVNVDPWGWPNTRRTHCSCIGWCRWGPWRTWSCWPHTRGEVAIDGGEEEVPVDEDVGEEDVPINENGEEGDVPIDEGGDEEYVPIDEGGDEEDAPIDEDGSGDAIDREGIVNMDINVKNKKRKNTGS